MPSRRLERPTSSTAARSRIESVGLALPQRRISSQEITEACEPLAGFSLEQLTGIRSRRHCSEGEDALSLAVDAARDCLGHSTHKARDIDLVISTSISKLSSELSFQFEPPLSLLIKDGIGATRASNFDVSNACAGMLTGVGILDGLIRSRQIRCGMVVSGEYVSNISDNAVRSIRRRSLEEKQLPSLTVGDCGAAVIVDRAPEGVPGIAACEFSTLSHWSDLCIGKACESGPGAAMYTDAQKLHDIAIEHAHEIVARALQREGIGFDAIDHVIPHQTTSRSIRKGYRVVTRKLGSGPKFERVVDNLRDFGNTASTSHFLALYRGLVEEKFAPGDRIMLVAFASGITLGVVLFTVGHLGVNYGRGHRGCQQLYA